MWKPNQTLMSTPLAFSVEIEGEETTTHFLIIKDPTMTRALPVAHDGIEAKIGAKKTETKNIRPVTMAVIPVLPPSEAMYVNLEQKEGPS